MFFLLNTLYYTLHVSVFADKAVLVSTRFIIPLIVSIRPDIHTVLHSSGVVRLTGRDVPERVVHLVGHPVVAVLALRSHGPQLPVEQRPRAATPGRPDVVAEVREFGAAELP